MNKLKRKEIRKKGGMERNVCDILKAADRAKSGRSVKGFSSHQSGFFDQMEVRGIVRYAEVWP